jgi:predicted nucleic acid-binding protein
MECLSATAIGARLDAKYGPGRPGRIHTSILALAEVAFRLARMGRADLVHATVDQMEKAAEDRIHGLQSDDVREAAFLHVQLRRVGDASLADALMLAQARRLRLPLLSGDRAFRGQEGVVPE